MFAEIPINLNIARCCTLHCGKLEDSLDDDARTQLNHCKEAATDGTTEQFHPRWQLVEAPESRLLTW